MTCAKGQVIVPALYATGWGEGEHLKVISLLVITVYEVVHWKGILGNHNHYYSYIMSIGVLM